MKRFARVLDLPYLLLAFSPLCWAGNVVVGRAVRGEIPPLSLNWWRWSLAATIFLIFVHRIVWRERHLLLKHWRLLLVLSFDRVTANRRRRRPAPARPIAARSCRVADRSAARG